MRIVSFVGIVIVMMVLNVSCKKETMEDYVPYLKDTINNPNGLLMDYGTPYNVKVNYNYFKTTDWTIKAFYLADDKSPVPTKLVYHMFYSNPDFTDRLLAFDPNDPSNQFTADFLERSTYGPGNYWKPYLSNEMNFNILNGDTRFTGRWFKYGNSDSLILAKKSVTLIFTKR